MKYYLLIILGIVLFACNGTKKKNSQVVENVVIESHDGKKLEAPQLYWDQDTDWIFTQEKFKFTNPEDGTVMDGEGMDFKKDLSFFKAHKTYGLMTIKEESND